MPSLVSQFPYLVILLCLLHFSTADFDPSGDRSQDVHCQGEVAEGVENYDLEARRQIDEQPLLKQNFGGLNFFLSDAKKKMLQLHRWKGHPNFGNAVASMKSYLGQPLTIRPGPRPVTQDQIPHGMMTQQSPPEVYSRWKQLATEYFKPKSDKVEIKRTEISLRSTFPAFFMNKAVRISKYSVPEFAHIHAPMDHSLGFRGDIKQGAGGGSMHVCVSCVDANEIVRLGWGEYHPMAGFNAQAPPCLMMIYAPRSLEEIAVSMNILKAAYAFTLDTA